MSQKIPKFDHFIIFITKTDNNHKLMIFFVIWQLYWVNIIGTRSRTEHYRTLWCESGFTSFVVWWTTIFDIFTPAQCNLSLNFPIVAKVHKEFFNIAGNFPRNLFHATCFDINCEWTKRVSWNRNFFHHLVTLLLDNEENIRLLFATKIRHFLFTLHCDWGLQNIEIYD